MSRLTQTLIPPAQRQTVEGLNDALDLSHGDALAKRTVNFANYSTDRIRINITAAFGIYSRLVEVQAWGN